MIDITKRLRHFVEVYHTVETVNELGENEKTAELLKKAYCEIVPLNSTVKNGEANTEANQHQFKFTFRVKSLNGLNKDWFFYLKAQSTKLSTITEILKIINL
nr:MAG TPA: PORTAL PROTEIN, 15 PROTEIN, HEAD PROTEIN, VIRAL INFECTION, TAILED.2A [Caudoviricetes sp.]